MKWNHDAEWDARPDGHKPPGFRPTSDEVEALTARRRLLDDSPETYNKGVDPKRREAADRDDYGGSRAF